MRVVETPETISSAAQIQMREDKSSFPQVFFELNDTWLLWLIDQSCLVGEDTTSQRDFYRDHAGPGEGAKAQPSIGLTERCEVKDFEGCRLMLYC